jgi:tetrahydromethanopterin S-methyltransferase subunit A
MVPLSLLYLFTPVLGLADFQVPRIMAWTGAAFLIPATWLFWRSHADLGLNWSPNVRAREGHELVTHGVYARVRHPMYAALLLSAHGLFPMLHNGVLSTAMLMVAILFVTVRARQEERFLLAQFGEPYRAYMSRVGGVLPRSEAWALIHQALIKRLEDFGFFLSATFARTRAVNRSWPYVPGRFFVLDPTAPVAVTTLGSVDLARELAAAAPKGLCIVGKAETENIGIEKIIKNIVANPAIRYIICAGNEPPKHLSGATLLALFKNGIDAAGRIPGAPGMRPVLPNTTPEEVQAFRQQVEPVDMVGCTAVARIAAKVEELVASAADRATPARRAPPAEPGRTTPRIVATAPPPDRIKLDKGGYFVITVGEAAITVEHYDYKERLLHMIEGKDARTIYWTLITNEWVTLLDHAAYLGKELARAEFSMKHGLDFEQDGA